MNCSISLIEPQCLLIHGSSSLIRHSPAAAASWHQCIVLDHDKIRSRIKARFEELGLSLTGVWLKGHGIGQTTIRNFLDGSSQSITTETIAKLARPLKTTEQWILFGDAEETGLDDDALSAIVGSAVEKIQLGMTLDQIKPAVATALREQLKGVPGGSVNSLFDAHFERNEGAKARNVTRIRRGGKEEAG